MDYPLSRAIAPGLVVLNEVGSTNSELVARAARSAAALPGVALSDAALPDAVLPSLELPDFSVVATLNQTAGRGRLDRVWVAPAGQALAVSVLLRPVLGAAGGRAGGGAPIAPDRLGWIPLIAGLAMTRAVRSVLNGPTVSLKWPNDVLIAGRKVSGLLAEMLPGGGTGAAGIIVGAGLNLTIPEAALPVPTATSLLLNGVEPSDDLADVALAAYLGELRSLWSGFLAAGADAVASGIHSAVLQDCSTLGQPVRVALPGGEQLLGTAVDLDSGGRLRLRTTTDGPLQTVAAGDITHLRYE